MHSLISLRLFKTPEYVVCLQATRVEQHGKKHIWLAKPEYEAAFKLPQQIPSTLANELSQARNLASANGPPPLSLKAIQTA